jgi:transcription elongation factor GreB
MGRYRPPQTPGSKYITPEGKQRLEQELDHLWRQRRPEVTRALTAAAAEGDRSENAEYIYRKKELREIDSRVRFLRKRLEGIIVVDRNPENRNKVYFGALVRLQNIDDKVSIYRVVGPDEIDPVRGFISMDSPMGKALLGKSLDDEFSIELPDGQASYLVIEVSYSPIRA